MFVVVYSYIITLSPINLSTGRDMVDNILPCFTGTTIWATQRFLLVGDIPSFDIS